MTDVAQSGPLASAGVARQAPRRRWSNPLLVCAGLFAIAALISGFTMLRDVDPFDEGLMLQAARRAAQGQVPYRDFLWAYGPAQPYLLAGLIKLFGVSLLHWRILRVLADAAVALVAYLLVRGCAPAPVALAVWLAAACEMSEPRSANPFPLALLAVLVALLVVSRGEGMRRREMISAAVLIGLAAAFRLDFALYGVAAVAVVIALRRGPWAALGVAAGALALIILVYLPFAVVDGPGSLWHALIGTSLQTGDYWRLPFPLSYHAPAGAGAFKVIKHGIDFYVPLLLIAGLGVAVVGILIATRRARRWLALSCGLIVLGAGALAYLLSRTDDFHTQPLLIVVVVALALSATRGPRPLRALAGGLIALLLVHGVANRMSALLRPPRETGIRLAVADGTEAPVPEARAIERMVSLVQANVPAGDPIYVAARRSDLVRFSDPLIYVLTERENPTPEDFGLLTGAAAQARIVAELARAHPRVIVRWTDPISSQREPNLRGGASGAHTLDTWIGAHYRLLARLYHYDVLVASG